MSLRIEELRDVIKIAALLNIGITENVETDLLEQRLSRICGDNICFAPGELDAALNDMASEGLISSRDGMIKLTGRGKRLSLDWRNLLLKKEPVIEVVAGLTDGSVTGLVVILSALLAGLASSIALFAAFLTISAVAITNFSSFFLGGITEDISDLITLENLMNHSLKDIADLKERDKSLRMVKELFVVLHSEISRSNLFAAAICGATTFLAGTIPIAAYLLLPQPSNIIVSLGIVGAVVGVFLVGYRSKRARVHWKVTLFETVAIIIVASIASLLLGTI
jgi:VIT1/CCC1 family predicted Fe2+/Mn2+ transporter